MFDRITTVLDRFMSRGQGWSYGTVIAVVAGLFSLGLLVPFIVADPAQSVRAGSGDQLTPIEAPDGTIDANQPGSDPDGGGVTDTVAAGPASGPSGPSTPGDAGSGSGTDGAGPTVDTTLPPAQPGRTASDVGVTEDTIRVGVIFPDLGGVGALGFNFVFDPNLLRQQYQAFFDEINEAGGVLGRQIEPFYEVADIADANDRRRACLAHTEGRKVFAVLSDLALQDTDMLCVTEEHGRPFIAGGDVDRVTYQRSNGLMFSHDADTNRIQANMAWLADSQGVLDGATIGIVSNPASELGVNEGLIPVLGQLGHDVAHVARLPQLPTDAQAQMPVEIAEMKRKGIDLVFLSIDPINGASFVQQSDSQLFTPRWVVSDAAAFTNDTGAAFMPDSFEGAFAVTALRTGFFRVGEPPGDFDTACMEILDRRLGSSPDPTQDPSDAGPYFNATRGCAIIRMFVRGAAAPGVDLTAASFSNGMQSLGPVDLGFSPPGSLAPGKFAAGGDSVRMARFKADCGQGSPCWIPSTPFVPSRY